MDSSLGLRPTEDRDIPVILSRLQESLPRIPHKTWSLYADPEKVTALIAAQQIASLVIRETYLLGFVVCTPWYTSQKVLNEGVVLRLYDGPGKFQDITNTMKAIAAKEGCAGIVAGTMLSEHDDALVRLYRRAGFTPQAHVLWHSTGVQTNELYR